MIDAYNNAVTNVNKAVDDADSSLRAVDEMPCHDLAALKSQFAALQVLFPPTLRELIILVLAPEE